MDRNQAWEAVGALRRASDRGHFEAATVLCTALILMGRSRDAEAVAERWHLEGRWVTTLFLAMIRSQRHDSRALDALDQLDPAIADAPPGALHYLRGFVNFQFDRVDVGAEEFRRAVEAGLEEAVWIADFVALGKDGTAEDLMGLYARGNPFAAHVVGTTAREEGNLDLAEEALVKAFEHGGREVGTELAALYDELEQPDDARSVRERLERLSPDEEPLFRPLRELARKGHAAIGLEWLHSEALRQLQG
jgi:tetratricopeptide (TPR) repeat protein